MMRDKLKNNTYWQNFLSKSNELRFRRVDKIRKSQIDPVRYSDIARSEFDKSIQNMMSKYSYGEEISSISNGEYDHIVMYGDIFKKRIEICGRSIFYGYDTGLGHGTTIPLISVSVLNRFSKNQHAYIFELIEENRYVDCLTKTFSDAVGYRLDLTTHDQYSVPIYEPILGRMGFDHTKQEMESAVGLFVEGWYQGLKECDSPMHDNHKSPHDIYFGYWCVEAAALTILFDLDDSRYRDHPHYPEEWADYARGQKFPLDFSERE